MLKIRLLLLMLFGSCMLTSCARDTHFGAYVFGHEVDTISLCDNGKTYWVEADPAIKNTLRKIHKDLTTMPYQSIFIEFTGYLSDKELEGFATAYDGYYHIEEIVASYTQRPQACMLLK